MRHTDKRDIASRPGRVNCLHHCFLCSNTLQYRICPNSVSHIHNAGDAFFTTLSYNIGRTELASKLLSCFMTTDGDDTLCPHLFGREYAQEANRAIANDHNRRTWLDVGSVGCEPASPQYIGSGQQVWDQAGLRNGWRRDQGTIRERYT